MADSTPPLSELAPCAHCGAKAEIIKEIAEPLDWFRVRCVNVECSAQTIGWGLRSTVRAAWNRRPSPPALEAGAKVLRERFTSRPDKTWDDLSDGEREEYRETMRAALLSLSERVEGTGNPPQEGIQSSSPDAEKEKAP